MTPLEAFGGRDANQNQNQNNNRGDDSFDTGGGGRRGGRGREDGGRGGNVDGGTRGAGGSGFTVLNIPPDQANTLTGNTVTMKNGQVRDYSKIECFKCGNFGQ